MKFQQFPVARLHRPRLLLAVFEQGAVQCFRGWDAAVFRAWLSILLVYASVCTVSLFPLSIYIGLEGSAADFHIIS